MSKKLMTIALHMGGLLAASAMKTEKDVRVAPHELVDVPEAYGRTLVDNKFAYKAEKPKAETAKTEAPKSSKPADGKADAIAAAEKAVDEARATLAEAGDDLVAKAAAEDAVKAAEDALAVLTA